jgi:mRNA-degrading endonuclease RelE of RelBE toxin-antitoxin system
MLTFSTRAKRDLKGLHDAARDTILAEIQGYADGTKPNADVCRRWVPPGWRMRVGDYRVFFRRENGAIVVLRVSHRRETYGTRRGP